jgi:hypothetical protein
MLKVLSDKEFQLLTRCPDEVEAVLFPPDVGNPFFGQYDLDKCWHELHYLLTRTVRPDGSVLGDSILGGREIGPELGYGLARILNPADVMTINSLLCIRPTAYMVEGGGRNLIL